MMLVTFSGSVYTENAELWCFLCLMMLVTFSDAVLLFSVDRGS